LAVVSATQQLLRFGIFELNLATQELRKSGTPVKLSPLPFKLLALLASHAGQIVTRQEIQEQLWGAEIFVDYEQSVNKCIKQIRKALNDNADNPLYIETLPRHGYRFLAPVVSKTIAAPGPRVVQSQSGELPRLPVLIGGRTIAPAAAGALAPSYPAVPDVAPVGPASETAHTDQSRSRHWRIPLICIASVLALLALIAVAFYLREHVHIFPKVTGKDTIVLADFDNQTGDPVFDDSLKQEVSIQLEPMPFLTVLSDRKVTGTLKLMNRSGSERLTEDVAREVCLRTNSKAMLTGSIVGSGNQYVIGVKAVDCNTGDVLAEAQEQAVGKEAVLKALDTAVWHLVGKLGNSLTSANQYSAPLAEATTPSLEALKMYSLGYKTQFAKGDTAALPFYKRAVELDPNFARAYLSIAGVYSNLNEVSRAAENATKAYELRDKVKSERERFSIEGYYYLVATGELEKAAQVYELWQQTYPSDELPSLNLGSIYSSLGDYEKSLEAAREAMRLEPKNGITYLNLGGSYLNLNRLDEAEAVYKLAEERKLESDGLLANRYQLAFLKGDTAQATKLVAAAMDKPGVEDLLLADQGNTDAWHGKLKSSRELLRRAMDSAQHNDAKETAAGYQVAAALWQLESGNPEQARAGAEAAVKLAPNRDVQAMAALALAWAGDTAKAQKLAVELDKTFPTDTLVQRYRLPTIRAAAALQHKDPNRAIELLKVTDPIELGDQGLLLPVYLRGEAYLMLHDGKAAANEFQKFIDHYGLIGNFPLGALARLGLARAYALEAAKDPALRGNARSAYQDFLKLWKDADSDIPIYKQAKAEYAQL
jgi:DNA-binding winged helix-turn-helix (wHTH) protein/tetratricopeptide (TPR) repeat protein